MTKLPQVRDYMDTDVPTLHPKTEIFEAVGFLLDNNRTGAPVINDDRELVGILTEKDCLRLLATGQNNQLPNGNVEDFMTVNTETVTGSMNVYFVAGLFLNREFRRFPVVDKQGHLVGAITRFDILRAVRSFLK